MSQNVEVGFSARRGLDRTLCCCPRLLCRPPPWASRGHHLETTEGRGSSVTAAEDQGIGWSELLLSPMIKYTTYVVKYINTKSWKLRG